MNEPRRSPPGNSGEVLTDEQALELDRTGIVKLPGAFSAADAARMRAVIWRELEARHGMVEHDRATWTVERPYQMKTTKKSRTFNPILGPVLRGVLDGLFGAGSWVEPKHMGQVLVTMPGTGPWRVPSALWHSDFGTDGVGLFAVKWWAVVGDLPPGAGGTPQIAGSHKLFARHLSTLQNREYKHARDSFMRSHPWLKELAADDGDPDRNRRFMDEDVDVDGLPARVVELTGAPGDVFITHPWVFHSIAVNASAVPRLMRTMAVRRR